MISKVDVEDLNKIILKNKELKRLINDKESNLGRIINSVGRLRNINIKQFFITSINRISSVILIEIVFEEGEI